MPFVPQDVLDRLAKLEREVRELRGRSQIRPALNQVLNGDVVIGEGGQLIVRAPSGVEHLRLGDIEEPGRAREFGVSIKRADGSVALSLYNGTGTDEPQVLRLFDSRVNGLLVEDVKAGGLNRPWLPFPELANEDTSTWPTTTGTAWTVVEQGDAFVQHPRVLVLMSQAGDGEMRLLLNDQVVATNATGHLDQAVEVPGYTFGMHVNIKVEARASTSGGTVRTKTRYLYGIGSAG